jgi:small-conductance mechanosensitive channel
MDYLRTFSNFIETITGINQEYIFLLTLSIITFIILKIISYFFKKLFEMLGGKRGYVYYQRSNFVLNIICVIIIFILWDSYLEKIITIISFISAALTLALREFIFNFFAGIFIKLKKPFDIDDRIEFKNMKGDVIATNTLEFEILEVGNTINADQSTGRVVSVPNSVALTEPIINYGKDFKYIWTEITVKTPLDVDSDEVKKLLYGVINSNEVVKRIPNKMRLRMEKLSIDQRIYYNKLEPIIYLRVVDSHIEFYIRYLVHPKKNRYVEDDIWNKILTLNKEGKIKLYVE